MDDVKLKRAKAAVTVTLVLCIVLALMSVVTFVMSITGNFRCEMLYASGFFDMIVPLPSLVISLICKSYMNKAIYNRVEGIEQADNRWVMSLVLSVMLLVAPVDILAFLYYIGSHY